jgi:signal transduction histidine kinase
MMKPEHVEELQQISRSAASLLKRGFDDVATWVAKLSWWRFFLYAMIALIIGAILQENLFSSSRTEDVTITHPKKHKPLKWVFNSHKNANSDKQAKKDANPPAALPAPPPPLPPVATPGDTPAVPAVPAVPAIPGAPNDLTKAANDAAQAANDATHALNKALERIEEMSDQAAEANQAAEEAAEEAANAMAEERVTHYRNVSSTWFQNFVVLLVLMLFGTKALMGSKKRAEALAKTATETAERESLHRQLSEAKLQMLQAQVEPHFLFNTLASVEYLIETDPPRAAAMQRSLIKYLRAVLPQMRESTVITNLGREADMVKAYLDLIKMRMEERLDIDFNIPEGLRSAAFPPMMLQSLVENAIKHGLECNADGGTLMVMAEVINNKLRVSVTDNGVGFGVVPSDGTGLGLPSIRERLQLLHGNQAQLIIEPHQPSGVIATIEVPYQLAD